MSFYITTPIYYVNAQPHLGHAYTTIAADVLARHQRQRGEEVFFLTGTDEHGEPVADAAKALGLEPKELADRNAERFKALMPRLAASNDFFIRTSDEQHGLAVQEVLQRVHDNGHVFKGLYEDNDPGKRLQMIVNYNTDVSQFWEWSGRGLRPVDDTNEAYKLGVNYVIYGLTH